MKAASRFGKKQVFGVGCVLVLMASVGGYYYLHEQETPPLPTEDILFPVCKCGAGACDVIVGTGSQEDPYTVNHVYYMNEETDSQRAAILATIEDANNGGKPWLIKGEGGDVYVRYNLQAVSGLHTK